jgi:hypothetical protein
MKNISLGVSILVLVTSLAVAQTHPQSLPAKRLESYFFSTDFGKKTKSDIRFMFFNSQQVFEKYFSPAATNKSVPMVNFSSTYVGGVVHRGTDTAIDIKLTKLVKHNSEAIAYFTIKKGKKQSWTSQPSYLFSFPFDKSIKSISYVINGQGDNAVSQRIMSK